MLINYECIVLKLCYSNYYSVWNKVTIIILSVYTQTLKTGVAVHQLNLRRRMDTLQSLTLSTSIKVRHCSIGVHGYNRFRHSDLNTSYSKACSIFPALVSAHCTCSVFNNKDLLLPNLM